MNFCLHRHTGCDHREIFFSKHCHNLRNNLGTKPPLHYFSPPSLYKAISVNLLLFIHSTLPSNKPSPAHLPPELHLVHNPPVCPSVCLVLSVPPYFTLPLDQPFHSRSFSACTLGSSAGLCFQLPSVFSPTTLISLLKCK